MRENHRYIAAPANGARCGLVAESAAGTATTIARRIAPASCRTEMSGATVDGFWPLATSRAWW